MKVQETMDKIWDEGHKCGLEEGGAIERARIIKIIEVWARKAGEKAKEFNEQKAEYVDMNDPNYRSIKSLFEVCYYEQGTLNALIERIQGRDISDE